MRRVRAAYGSSLGKKVAMALSGIVLFGYVVLHMLGNLKAFEGREAIGGYSLFLREFGQPMAPHAGVLWAVRIVLLLAVLVHILAAFQLWAQSRAARRQGYRRERSQVFSYASRTMRWGGVIILAFVVYHILHMTTGTVHPEFEHGEVYDNLVIGFQSLPVVAAYTLAVGALSLHLYHGLWSIFTTLGVEHPTINRLRRPSAAVVAIALFLGFIAVPLAVQFGILAL